MNSKVAVIGTGYVGLTTGACLAHLGHTVCCLDVVPEKIASLERGEIPIVEDGLAEIVQGAVKEGRLEPYLNFLDVEAGDVIFNPTGTVHALGAGIFIYEIQQSSDLTYRLYDYNRRGSDGKLRELHIDKALEVANLSKGQNAKVILTIDADLQHNPKDLARLLYYLEENKCDLVIGSRFIGKNDIPLHNLSKLVSDQTFGQQSIVKNRQNASYKT